MEKTKLTYEEEQVIKNLDPIIFPNCLNIAVVGKTGVGKSSFINAIRNLTCKDQNAADVKSGSESCDHKEERSEFSYRITNSNVEIEINLIDTMGHMGNINPQCDNFSFIESVKNALKIVEFDAIIFIYEGRLTSEELSIAKRYVEKNVLIFFVMNKMNNFLIDNIRQITGNYSYNRSLNDQYNENKKELNQCVEKEMDAVINLIDRNMVFNCIVESIQASTSLILNSDDYKKKIIKNSIYFITSTKEDFLNECISKDGFRLKTEIEQYLVHAKLNNFNIDLFDPFSERLIRIKKKYLISNLFKDTKKI
ncbi:interferon-inducible GTPase 1-like [Brachionus plicatilis]|uniref:Interferon-inducible GTPase 1-like n=1 Tax=Brachionus plicatilis TaxID=10195 RepID=A0A3M7RPA7_BRAPC|nr:interferon-inducible GTPase 1-like [Brachionus plicatilis]